MIVDSTRLTIHTLHLQSFKSYSLPTLLGPFHSSFTSVVGPNGSGKSNVIDALLFVFGFKARKLRQGRLSDLIHKSEGCEPDRCRVEVEFRVLRCSGSAVEYTDDEKVDSYGSGEEGEVVKTFKVARWVRKSAKSETSGYEVDGQGSTFKEVRDILVGYGVDLDHKRFLILQGEVEAISLMKAKGTGQDEGLLEYLEDIIGTRSLAQPIEEKASQVDVINEEYEQKLLVYKVVVKEVESVRERSESALKGLEEENEVVRRNNAVLQVKKVQGSSKVLELQKQLKEVVLVDEDANGDLTDKLERLKEDVMAVESDVKEGKKKVSKSERDEMELREREKLLKNRLKRGEKALEDDSFALKSDKVWINNYARDALKVKGEADALQVRLASERDSLTVIQKSLESKSSPIQLQIEGLEESLIDVKKGLLKHQSSSTLKALELDKVKERVESGESTYAYLKGLLEAKKTELKSLSSQIDQLIPFESTKIDTDWTDRISFLKGRKSYLFDELKNASNSSQSSKVLASLLKSDIEGIKGRLGSLGKIDQKYDVAVTTCCSQLPSIVVESVQSAQRCIQFLKDNSLGRATFICMDKVSKPSVKRVYPEGVERLVDLVDTEYFDVFNQVLSDTLVVNDLEQANRVAYGPVRYRVVTLDGQLIEKSGAMSGGGSRVLKGGFSATKATVEKELAEVEEELEVKVTLQASFEAEVKEQKKREKELLLKRKRLSLTKTQMVDDLSGLETQVKKAEKKRNPDDRDLAKFIEIQGDLAGLASLINPIKLTASNLQNEINVLKDKIMEIGGIKLQLQHAKVTSLTDQLLAASKSLIKLDVERDSKVSSLSLLEESIQAQEDEVSTLRVQVEELEGSFNGSLKASLALKDSVRLKEDKLEELELALKGVKAEIKDDLKALNKRKELNMNLKADLILKNQALKAAKALLKEIEGDLAELSLIQSGFDDLDSQIDPLKVYSEDELNAMNLKSLVADLHKLKDQSITRPNMTFVKEFRAKLKVHDQRKLALDEVSARRDVLKSQYEDLTKHRLLKFMKGFTAISLQLKEMYKMITMGGNAELELVDSLDPFTEGVEFSVMPPKKSWKNIANLSGGEKTLSSLALVFALHHYKPTPLYVMDEIDAALDFRNVSIIAAYIKERTKNAQFIIISLRNNMFELADRLVGVYKTDNSSKSVAIDPAVMKVDKGGDVPVMA